MHSINHHHVGEYPESDALRLRQLYYNDGIDQSIVEEFGPTVSAYRSLELDVLTERVVTRYSGECPQAYSVIVNYDTEDVGQAIWGEKSFLPVGSSDKIEGVNVSAWILKQYRGRGLGSALLKYATNCAVSTYPGLARNNQIWTSIRSDNFASISACLKAGFFELGVQADKPERLLYVLR